MATSIYDCGVYPSWRRLSVTLTARPSPQNLLDKNLAVSWALLPLKLRLGKQAQHFTDQRNSFGIRCHGNSHVNNSWKQSEAG
jgi:hypothetical protein